MPGMLFARFSMMFMASPELTPGAPWPEISNEGYPRNLDELVGVVIQEICANEEKGTIPP